MINYMLICRINKIVTLITFFAATLRNHNTSSRLTVKNERQNEQTSNFSLLTRRCTANIYYDNPTQKCVVMKIFVQARD
jgi:hypothetical protein